MTCIIKQTYVLVPMLLLLLTNVAVVLAGEETLPYQQLRIIAPADNSAFWSTPGNVTIEVDVEPGLSAERGDEVRVFLDRKRAGEGLIVKLTNVDRGIHEVYAEIVDNNGRRLILSPAVRFTLHRPSILLPSR